MIKGSKYLVMAIVLISTLLIAGCSSDTSSSGEGDKVKISMMIRWVSAADIIEKKIIPEFEKEHPNIEVKLQTSFNKNYTQALQAAVNGGNLPDIFASHPSLPVSKLYDLGVLHKLDDVIGDDKDKYEEGTWTKGSTVMDDGSIYAFPIMSGHKDSFVMYYNKDILKKAGLSEKDVPKSWDQLMAVSKKIEKKTDAYGVLVGFKDPWVAEGALTQMASAISPEVLPSVYYSPKGGDYKYDTKGTIQSIEFFKKMYDQKILHPSSSTLDPAEAPALFASGKSAFLFDGAWTASNLVKDGFKDFGVSFLPTKDGKKQYLGFQGTLAAGLLVNKETKHYKEVKEFLKFMKDKGYETLVKNGSQFSPIAEINKKNASDNVVGKTFQLQYDTFIAAPNPVYHNKNVTKVETEMSGKGPQKTVGDVLAGYLTGQVRDVKGTLHKVSEKKNTALENAVKEVKGKGNKISLSDWKFNDWTPFEPYKK
ncbi:carbohydrate ABC transporter substrate-binding protein (CUT1 family) [Scopulibacillus darangshiensis]|uniref:Carbohydrate ABC transporter substrate-binding protein (CUT1 family) n=1 Tax=Scopulibacillus darangshiensis TaxID=442528 RepID=A0A4V2SL79_9BACL|nr:sugar ABC transporter substrate-binding protein [Scopulibacillus darangshiensis]TCP22346.1 carbohydrate ABC transporter substrate-binding protein (CUT1 family) [Scopulibacillus darangshiensis]